MCGVLRSQFCSDVLKVIKRNMPYYAVAKGRKVGIYANWAQCEEQVKGFKGAVFKKFNSRFEAEQFISPTKATTDNYREYVPDEFAVPLGQKQSPPVSWAHKQEQKKKPADFWPEDVAEENTVTEDDMVSRKSNGLFCKDHIPSKRSLYTMHLRIMRPLKIIPKLCSMAAMYEVEGLPEPSTSRKRKTDAEHSLNSKSKSPRLAFHVQEAVALKHFGAFEFAIDSEGYVIVYTDGSCLGNGRSDACAGFGVYFGDDHPLNAGKPVLGRVTNNVGEIQASIYAIKTALDLGMEKLIINTDSKFLINSITKWVPAWKSRGWRLKNMDPVKNVDDFKELDELLQNDDIQVKWNYVEAHKGIKGNEMADKLAKQGSQLYREMNSRK